MEHKALIINRTFQAPVEHVWEAFSTGELLAKWWGPKGMETTVKAFEFKIGGRFHYCMATPDGSSMWGLFVYKELEPTTRMVLVNSFSNEAGEIVPPPVIPFGENWPLEICNTFTFEADGAVTHMKMVSIPINATAESTATFEAHIGNMQQGFGAAFDQLEDLLPSVDSTKNKNT